MVLRRSSCAAKVGPKKTFSCLRRDDLLSGADQGMIRVSVPVTGFFFRVRSLRERFFRVKLGLYLDMGRIRLMGEIRLNRGRGGVCVGLPAPPFLFFDFVAC